MSCFYKKICVLSFFYAMGLALHSPEAWCSDNTARIVEKSVETSIHTRQESQQKLDQWEEEKQQLLLSYEALLQEQEELRTRSEALKQELSRRQKEVGALKIQHRQNQGITREILPFLQSVYGELNEFVLEDTPFLKEERHQRMARLGRIMADADVTVAEKYRKLMEALFVEAQYGNTIEVTREKIAMGSSGVEVLADILRLGRISLFALTLDQGAAGYFNVVEQKWLPLDSRHVRAIHAAIETGKKQRTVEMLSMPLGKIRIP